MSPHDLIWAAESGRWQEGPRRRQGPYRHCLRSQDVTPGAAEGLGKYNPWDLKTTEAGQGWGTGGRQGLTVQPAIPETGASHPASSCSRKKLPGRLGLIIPLSSPPLAKGAKESRQSREGPPSRVPLPPRAWAGGWRPPSFSPAGRRGASWWLGRLGRHRSPRPHGLRMAPIPRPKG